MPALQLTASFSQNHTLIVSPLSFLSYLWKSVFGLATIFAPLLALKIGFFRTDCQPAHMPLSQAHIFVSRRLSCESAVSADNF
jgi:hypothetical protein